jgi:hypothetical protein
MRFVGNRVLSRPKRKLSIHSAALLMFGLVGSASISAALEERYTLSQKGSSATKPHEKKGLRVTVGMSGQLIQDGMVLGFTVHGAPDGVSLIVIYNTFDDAPQASAWFEKEIARAAKVVERGEKKDQAGKIVGKRAQILLPSPNEKLAAVMWTDGRQFHEIDSSSLHDILELEKVYKY